MYMYMYIYKYIYSLWLKKSLLFLATSILFVISNLRYLGFDLCIVIMCRNI